MMVWVGTGRHCWLNWLWILQCLCWKAYAVLIFYPLQEAWFFSLEVCMTFFIPTVLKCHRICLCASLFSFIGLSSRWVPFNQQRGILIFLIILTFPFSPCFFLRMLLVRYWIFWTDHLSCVVFCFSSASIFHLSCYGLFSIFFVVGLFQEVFLVVSTHLFDFKFWLSFSRVLSQLPFSSWSSFF